MSDLRTGLVEAMARGLVAHAADRDLLVLLSGNVAHRLAEGALDYALGFLTDNVEAWEAAESELPSSPGPRRIGDWQRVWLLNLLAVLRDQGPTPADVEHLWKELHPDSERR